MLRQEIDRLLSQTAGQKTVLVVDENAETVKTLSGILSATGYHVIEAFDRETFLQQAIGSKPDMIIGNIALLEQHNLLRTLRVEEGLRHTSIMVYENRN